MDTEGLDRKKLPEQISAEITRLILNRVFAEGDALPSEAELGRRFNVSKTVIREALGRLTAHGLVLTQQGKPSIVAPLTAAPLAGFLELAIASRAEGLRDALSLRAVLEPEIAAAAALRITAEQLARFEAILAEMAANLEDEERYTKSDLAFHLLMAECGDNLLMRFLMEALTGTIRWNIVTLYRRRDLRDASGTLPRHQAIVAALRAHDAEAARAAVRQHFRYSTAVAEAILAAATPAWRK